ncbi:MAG: hypothetical protein LAP21_27375 [Acidobacteriia bacterium]|nr:hypothetical protein [Terriglobia bacterium]
MNDSEAAARVRRRGLFHRLLSSSIIAARHRRNSVLLSGFFREYLRFIRLETLEMPRRSC